MGVSVSFNYNSWITLFPEFTATSSYAGVSAAKANLYFQAATMYCRNDGGGPVTTPEKQTTLLNFLTAHIAQLLAGSQLQAASPLVGAITNATEGSVSVVVKNSAGDNPAAAWYQQTEYGAFYWDLTSVYRNFRFVPGPRRRFNPPWFGRGWP